MTSRDAILFSLRQVAGLVQMFTADLDHQQMHHRVVPAANATAWILGHLVLSERRALKMLGQDDLPALPEGFEERFARNDEATQSADYGDATMLPALFAEHRQRLVAAVESADEAAFDQPLEQPMRIASTVGELLVFFGIHVSTHLGQISMIRRSLGMKPLI